MRALRLFLLLVALAGCSDSRDRGPDPAPGNDGSVRDPDVATLADTSVVPPSSGGSDAASDPGHDASPSVEDPRDAGDPSDAAAVGDAGDPIACAPMPEPCEGDTVVRGDVVVATAADVDALSGITCIDGNVRLEGDALRALVLPSLRRITGNLLGQFLGGLETIELACVERVADFVLIGNDRLAALRMPRLVRSERIAVRGGEALATLELDALERAGSISLWLLPSLVRADLRRLSSASHGVEASQLDALVELGLDSLRTVGTVSVEHDALLETLDLPSLETGSLLVQEAPALRVLSAPALGEAESISIYGARSLEVVRLGALRTVGDALRLGGATASETLDLASLETVRGSLEISFSRMPILSLPRLISVGHTGLGFIPEGDFGVSDTQLDAI
ncbi:MAG: hypothetical protein IT379_03625, partial [Deltaproteobacteria bacterium]|nr:hypothetical protein [Deltaproteobacteria bacterium]